jgi:hypothetical protein
MEMEFKSMGRNRVVHSSLFCRSHGPPKNTRCYPFSLKECAKKVAFYLNRQKKARCCPFSLKWSKITHFQQESVKKPSSCHFRPKSKQIGQKHADDSDSMEMTDSLSQIPA